MILVVDGPNNGVLHARILPRDGDQTGRWIEDAGLG